MIDRSNLYYSRSQGAAKASHRRGRESALFERKYRDKDIFNTLETSANTIYFEQRKWL